MTQVFRYTRISLPTSTSEKNYFYLTNSHYNSYSSYIYICLEDNGFELNFNNIQYCFTNTYPGYYPENVVNNCSFTTISYYFYQKSSGIYQYYYKIPITSSYTYSIVYYDGKNSLGFLYVTSDYIDLSKSIKMTEVSINNRTSLTTISLYNKYFYLTNTDYNSYIYICLEDYSFGLNNDKIKFCRTNTNPSSNPDTVIRSCSFSSIDNYNSPSSSGTNKYYYKISTTSSYTYSIVNYDGKNPAGYLFVTSDYVDLSKSTKMTQVSRNSKTPLPTSTSFNKYFYLTNSNYYSYSNYIYIYLEDNNFDLSYNDIKYCFTSTNPSSNPDSVIRSCSFTSINYYSYKSSSGIYKYYHKIPTTSSNTYSIVYYDGKNSLGYLYVTSDYNDLAIQMTYVPRNSKTSLPILNSADKYFYVKNSDYSPYSNYFYFYLEDNSFSLSFKNIKYCKTNIDPYSNPFSAVNGCSFNTLSYYDTKYLSGSTIYHYKFEISSSYTYSIVYYDGIYSYGNLYAYCYYEKTSDEEVLSTGAIVGIVIGSIAFLVTCIIIMYYCCSIYRKNKNDFGNVIQPNYFAPIYSAYPLNQSNAILPVNKPDIPLQVVPMTYKAN